MDGNNMNYQNNTYQQPAPAQPGKGFGIASMVLGIIALLVTLLSCCLPFMLILSGLLGLLSIVFGIIAIAKKGGKGMGIAGLICSGIGLLLAIVILIFRSRAARQHTTHVERKAKSSGRPIRSA